MNVLAELFRWTLVTSSAAAGVAMVVWLLLGLAGRTWPPRTHYWLWMLVVIRLLLPRVPATNWSPFSDWTQITPARQSTAQLAKQSEAPSPRPSFPTPSAGAADQTPRSGGSPDTVSNDGQKGAGPPWLVGAAVLWVTGMFAWLMLRVAQQ